MDGQLSDTTVMLLCFFVGGVSPVFVDPRVPHRLLNLATGAEIFTTPSEYRVRSYVIYHETTKVNRELFIGDWTQVQEKMREYAEKLGAGEI